MFYSFQILKLQIIIIVGEKIPSRQRGDVGGSAKKVGLRIWELERLYGIENGGKGGNRYTTVEHPSYSEAVKTQEDIANEMGMTVQSLHNYKLLSEMIPELSDLVDTRI